MHGLNKIVYQGLKNSIWVAGDTGNGNVRGSQQPRPATTTTERPSPITTQRTYIRPSVRSLGLGGGPPYSSRLGGVSGGQSEVSTHQGSFRTHPDTYRDFEVDEEEDGAGAGPWYVYECIPLLKNLAGFEEGSNRNSILTKFIKHMNQNAVGSVKEFIGSDKSCSSGPGTCNTVF